MDAPKLLVVDDQPINVQLLKRKLEREGIHVLDDPGEAREAREFPREPPATARLVDAPAKRLVLGIPYSEAVFDSEAVGLGIASDPVRHGMQPAMGRSGLPRGTVEIGGFAVNELKVWNFGRSQPGDAARDEGGMAGEKGGAVGVGAVAAVCHTELVEPRAAHI